MSSPTARRGRIGKRQVTLKDVAALAGVGPITASRVLREPDKVSPQRRQQVLDAVRRLGYVANPVASSMAAGHSRMVPVVVPTLTHSVYVPFLRGVHDALDARGYDVLLGTTEYRQDAEERLVRGMLGWAPAGVMVSGVDHRPALRRHLREVAKTRPVIEFMDLDRKPIDRMVGFSHRAVGTAVANWFADRGFVHVAIVGAQAPHDLRAQRRHEAFTDALRARGLPSHYAIASAEPFSIALGGRLLADLLQRHPEVQAVCFANDDLAAGALFEAQRRGLSVPRDLALMGFNDTDIAAQIVPSLSSVAVDRYGMGRAAADLLLARLSGDATHPKVIDTGFSIVERDSTAAPPRTRPRIP